MSSRHPLARRVLATTLLTASAFALVEGAAPSPAEAYKLYYTNDGVAMLRWWRRDFQFHVANVEPKEVPLSAVQGLTETALAQWIDTTCGLVPTVTFGGMVTATRATTPTTASADPDNVIVFIREASDWIRLGNATSWIAITKIAHDPKSGEIVDADIEVNDGGYTFSIDGTPELGEVDFLSMLTHEAGHFFGMDHSLDKDATMYATYSQSAAGALAARELSQDDTDGVCALYTNVPEHVDPGSKDDGGCAAGGGLSISGLALLALGSRRARKASASRKSA